MFHCTHLSHFTVPISSPLCFCCSNPCLSHSSVPLSSGNINTLSPCPRTLLRWRGVRGWRDRQTGWTWSSRPSCTSLPRSEVSPPLTLSPSSTPSLSSGTESTTGDGWVCIPLSSTICLVRLCPAGHDRDSELELLVLFNHWLDTLDRSLVCLTSHSSSFPPPSVSRR